MTNHTPQSLEKIYEAITKHDTKRVPFPAVIKAFSGKDVIEIDKVKDRLLLSSLNTAMTNCIRSISSSPILSKRVNEVGNAMEQPVIDAINNLPGNLQATKPRTKSGAGKSTGYPDVLISDGNKHTYLEVKTFNSKSLNSTLRAFYLSPSDEFKIVHDARHILVGFEVEEKSPREYIAKSFKLMDLYKLPCNIKFEINCSNKLMYKSCESLT